jgi:PHD-finger/PHD-zinc-finger like domain
MNTSEIFLDTQILDYDNIDHKSLDFTYYQTLIENNIQEVQKKSKKRYQNLEKHRYDMDSVIPETFCCACNTPGIVFKCFYPSCTNYFHLNCYQVCFETSKHNTIICKDHKNMKTDETILLSHLQYNFNTSTKLVKILKDQKTPKSNNDLSGKLFWYGICQQYFSQASLDIRTPYKPPLAVSTLEETWISKEIFKLESEILKANTQANLILEKLPIQSQVQTKPIKPIDQIIKAITIPVSLKNILRKNYQKIEIKNISKSPKDYHNLLLDEEIVCSVCNNGDSIDENLIVICSKCQLPVHNICYKISAIPDTEWLCDYCKSNPDSTNLTSRCYLCPIKGGASKLFKGKWAHITCTQYLQSCSSDIDEEKFKLKCFECKLRVGACVQCCHGKCAVAFHVECRKDLIDLSSGKFFCPSHKASRIDRVYDEITNNAGNYILKIAEYANKNPQPPQHPRNLQKNKPIGNSSMKKIVIEMNKDKVVVKISKNNKIFKVLEYFNKNISNNDFLNILETQTTLEDLPLKSKKSRKPTAYICEASEKNLKIKMKINCTVLLDDFTRKVFKKSN